MPYANRQKRLTYLRNWNKQHYQNNKVSERIRVKQRKEHIAQWFKEYKEKQACEICGENYAVCLDFHHLNESDKDFNIAYVKAWGWSIERIKKEIKKYQILCSNCHRKIHA